MRSPLFKRAHCHPLHSIACQGSNELSYEMPRFAPTPWNMEIRPIIGVRYKDKAIIGYAFPVPGKSNDAGGATSASSMTMGTQPRPAQNPFLVK